MVTIIPELVKNRVKTQHFKNMITKFKTFYEYKLTDENYNKYYYLVLRFNDNTFESLCDEKFEDLKGISDNPNIINSFFDIRDVLLIMDKKNSDELNKLIKVDYDDVEKLTKDNFKIMKRITNDSDDYSIHSIIYQGFRKHTYYKYTKNLIVGDKLNKLLKKIDTEEYKKVFKYIDKNTHYIFDSIKNTITFDDFTYNVYNSLDKLDYKYSPIIVKNILEYIILTYALLFKKEGEIIVDSKYYHIPKNSTILIKKQHPDSYSFDEHKVILDKYFNNLKEKYNIKEIEYKKDINNQYISATHKSAFPIIRYLDKIKF